MSTEHLSIRLTPAGAEMLRLLSDRMGISSSAVLEIHARLALTGVAPAPGAEYREWLNQQLDQLGNRPLIVVNRRVTGPGKHAVDKLADRWGDSQSGVAEYLVWYAVKSWLGSREYAEVA